MSDSTTDATETAGRARSARSARTRSARTRSARTRSDGQAGQTGLPRQRAGRRRRDDTPVHLTPEERAALGVEARQAVEPGDLGELPLPPDRPGAVAELEAQAGSRVPELVPVRHGRMVATPFTFYRGAAALMARDLAVAPTSGLPVQLCGDAHLSNFGVFASPERRLLFDVNDFDETFPGPWEWDVKRLVASLAVAGRQIDFGRKERRRIARAAATRYQVAMARFAGMRELDIFYAGADIDDIRAALTAQGFKGGQKRLDKAVAKARGNDSLRAVAKLTEVVDGQRRIRADPPLLVPVADMFPRLQREAVESEVRELLREYGRTLLPDRRLLLERYRFVDMAHKVVGVGSVGTRCWVVLLEGRDGDDPLFLQVKQAQESVLAPYVFPSGPRRRPSRRSANQGERVVTGQRLMQAAGDIFLGWQRVTGPDGVVRDFYVRQLRDQKGAVVVEQMVPEGMRLYAELCGWTLARAHARTGDAIAISAYLGEGSAFSKALADFAERYADLNEHDHAEMVAAVHDGRLEAETGV
jgi:uncharacterized protein (DUF2252 family)